MLLKKSPLAIILLTCLLSIYGLFTIKENVVNIKSELSEVNSQIRYETDTIHLLKAELAYLTSPARLKSLNDQYIKLTDTQISQVSIDPLVQNLSLAQKSITSVANINSRIHKQVKWRYKKGPSKYLTMACNKKR